MYQKELATYETVGLETSVNQASPHQLIVLLFDGALSSIKIAKLHMEKGNIKAKGEAISKVINIVENGLKSSLDLEKGGEIAANLEQLYSYILRQLLLANLRNDLDKLQHCYDLLSDISEAWRDIA